MKYLLGTIIAISFSMSAFAQGNKFEVGVQGGPSITFFRRSANSTPTTIKTTITPMAAFSCGAFFQYNLNKTFSLRTDPAFERKGYSYKATIPGFDLPPQKDYINYNYITVPVLLRAGVGNKIRYFVNAGPYIGFLLSEESINKTSNNKFVYNSTSSRESIDLGLTTGLGIAIPIKNKFALSAEIRNNLGLTNTNKNKTARSYHTGSANLLIGIAYKFGKKKI